MAIYIIYGKIMKIAIGATTATAEAITPDLIYINNNDFAVDYDGNIFYSFDANSTKNFRIRTYNGHTFAIDDKFPLDNGVYFTGADGYIYYSFKDSPSDYAATLRKIEITGNTSDDITITPVNFVDSDGNESNANHLINKWNTIGPSYREKVFSISDKKIIFQRDRMFTLNKDGSAKIFYYSQSMQSANSVKAGADYIFVLDGNSIQSINIETGSISTKAAASKYFLIHNFEVTSGDIVIINALTYDSKDILVQISPDGEEKILSENLSESDILILTKVR